MPQITANWLDAERMTAALTTSIVDCMALAGSDESETLIHCREAANYAHTLARFLDRLSEGLAGEVLVSDDDTDDQRELRAAVARRGNPPNVSALFPQVRISGDGPEAA